MFHERWRSAAVDVGDGLRRWSDLPQAQREDEVLQEHLRARYGPRWCRVRFRLVDVRSDIFAAYRLDDFEGHYMGLVENDEAHDHAMRLHGEPLEQFEGGAEQYAAALKYLARFRSGDHAAVPPVVVDPNRLADLELVDVIDGYHRVHAALEAGAVSLRCLAVESGQG